MDDNQQIAIKVVETMMASDQFSKWLGIEVVAVAPGSCTLQMSIKEDMLNGFSIAHGGITYSLADSALAFASNAHGRKAVSVETSISHLQALKKGDKIKAVAFEESCTEKIAVYSVKITNQDNKTVALFKGTVYRTATNWFN